MSMLDLLARAIGPQRAVSAYVFAQRWGIGILLGLGFVIVLTTLLLRTSSERLDHVAYVEASVTAVTPLKTQTEIGVIVDVLLPDGTVVRLTEVEGLISASLTDRACVEQRRNPDTGALHYRLRLPHRCAG